MPYEITTGRQSSGKVAVSYQRNGNGAVKLIEITKEGTALGHCVGGYVYEHARGMTNIIFLRRKSEEQIPFYTIEIKNDKVIQIHGRHNCWLGNNPEAIPFMFKYLTQLGVRFNKTMLLNLGRGYSPSDNLLPESALYSVCSAA